MLQKLPPWLRAAVVTGFQSASGAILLGLADVLSDLREWDIGDPVPNFSAFGSVVVGAVVGLGSAVVTAAHRALRPPQNTYPEPAEADKLP